MRNVRKELSLEDEARYSRIHAMTFWRSGNKTKVKGNSVRNTKAYGQNFHGLNVNCILPG